MRMFHFFAMLSRMKHISRWGLMRNTRTENLCEHSYETAVIAHCLAVLRNVRFGGSCDPQRAAVLAMFHDCTEIITGDLPTPVKYVNPRLRDAYGQVERMARDTLLGALPPDMAPEYGSLLGESLPGDQALLPLVKAADKLSAIIKCVEERGMGNTEFSTAEETLCQSVREMHLPEADCFLEEFLPSYGLTLDQLQWQDKKPLP